MNINEVLLIVKDKIEKSRYIIISTHTNPDGDAIGSEIALRNLVKHLGKKVYIINDSPTPDNLKFLDTENSILHFDKSRDIQHFYSADLIIIVDLNDPKRLKSVQEPVSNSRAFKIVIDHHIEPQKFADLYAINTEETSTGQMIFNLIRIFENFIIDSQTASAIYAAIMTDTGSFRFPGTNQETHITIGKLIECGADPVSIYDNIYNTGSLAATHILGEALRNIKLYIDGKMSLMMITDDMFRSTGAKNEDIDNFVEKTLALKGIQLGVLISNMPSKNEIRVSFRSKGVISARQLAAKFGGGGHFHAAGARLFDMSLDDAKSKIIEEAAKLF
ncbi:MAG: DHH family phosphoesterase [Candidatus Kapabacteria bacterium]|nr:DHH family phosphoesterase [Ignavibacteriota bacterium]MCW5883654.1 DHH family phosphoesterase [Candidatus Kapabacteria bacterium]